ncbi:MAG: AAA family ATPase [Desulforhopalus sp.]
MTEIQKDTERNETHPFREDVVPGNYFSGGGRDEVLSQMGDGLREGVALLVLTGDEGSGKTTLCHMFEKEQAAEFVTVYFPRTVDSFDDVVKIIAERLKVTPSDNGTGRNRDGTLREIADCLQHQSKKLLVIFDEAENIYLATLERIRKMLDRVWALGGRMHILFSGRNTFNENYDQLSICDFERSDELYFLLRPLTESETIEYLYSATPQITEEGGEKLLPDELAEEISGLAEGNFRKIKELARQSIADQGADESFMVLLENVEEETVPEDEDGGKKVTIDKFERSKEVGREVLSRGKENLMHIAGRSADISRDLLKRGRQAIPELKERNEQLLSGVDKYRTSLPYIGAGICALLLLLIFFSLGGDREHVEQIIHEEKVSDVPVVVTESVLQQVEPIKVEVPVEEAVTEDDQSLLNDETITDQGNRRQLEVREEVQAAVEDDVQAVPGETVEIDPEPADKLEIQPVVIVEEEKPRPRVEKKIVELKPSPSMKQKPPAASTTGQSTITLQPRQEVAKTNQIGRRYGARQLLDSRIRAGTSWQRNEVNGLYTVQLMVLASKSAENNLVQMLAEDRYRQEAGNFYILKKKTPPGNMFVFYGEYPTIAMARLAQKSLPQFLRIHKPYTISVKGAVAKVR